jgi:hypothetical protein
MKRLAVVTLIGALAFVASHISAVAQTGMTGGMHHMDDPAKTNQQAGMVNHSVMMQMRQMAAGDSTMAADFDRLQTHFNQMMKIDDMAKLKTEMAKHQEMMAMMHNEMMHNRQMAEHMEGMMSGGGTMHSGGMMQGMMSGGAGMHSKGMTSDSSSTAQETGSGH